MKITFEPIGIIRSEKKKSCNPDEIKALPSTIYIYDEFISGLKGIEQYTEIDVVFFIHKDEEIRLLGTNRYGDYCGVFASRWPSRPNHIGITRCRIISVNHSLGKLIVEGLDALDGSPLLDIKCAQRRMP